MSNPFSMKLRSILALMMITGLTLTSYAQPPTGSIAGQVMDVRNKALTGATIRLRQWPDTAIEQHAVAGSGGAFIFNKLPQGAYTLTVTHVGYRSFQLGRINVNATQLSIILPPIILQPAADQTLKVIVITAKRPMVEQMIDRTVVNVDAMISVAGGSALDALSKSPGVMVDLNDQISLNGKRGVLVLIDDRPTHLSGADLAAYLRSLPAGSVDKLELLSNPPARYDASGGAVINIVLKKNRPPGFSGSISLGYNQGVYTRSNDALNLNYHTPKFNVFGNISYGLDQNYSNQIVSRYFYQSNGASPAVLLQDSYDVYRSVSWNGRAGIDYQMNPETTIGLMLTGTTRPKTDRLNYNNHQFLPNGLPDSSSTGANNAVYGWRNIGLNLNFQRKLNKAGSQLSADLDAVAFNSDGNQDAPVDQYNAAGVLTSERHIFLTPAQVRIYSAKADYSRPITGKAEFSAGIKSSFVSNDNQLQWFEQTVGGLAADYSKSNHFRYTEQINSAYVNLKKSWQRWGIQGGLRAERTIADGHQFANPAIADSSFKKHYSGLFPSLYLSYRIDTGGRNTLVLSYNQRISRPGYQQLDPFLFYRDPYTYSSGNPNLVPYHTHYLELKYSYRQYIAISAGYWISDNQTGPVTQAEGKVFITRPFNYLRNRTYCIIPYFSFDPAPWWSVHANAVLLLIINKGSADGVTLNQKTNVHEIETSSELRLSKSWSAQIDGFFPGSQAFGQSRSDATYKIGAGIRKVVFNGNGTLSLNMNDIFNTAVSHSQTIGIDQVAAFSTRQTDSRRVGVAFSYRFGKSANDRKRNHNTGGVEEEKGRTN